MTKQEFIDMVAANHKRGKWLSCTVSVEGVNVGIKSYGKWVQRMEANCKPYYSGTECKTVKAFKSEISDGIDYLLAV